MRIERGKCMAQIMTESHADTVEALKSKDFGTTGDWKSIVADARKLVSPEGFNASHADVPDKIRKVVAQGRKSGTSAANAILTGAGVTSLPTNLGGNMPVGTGKRVAALAMLQNLYLLKKFGSHKLWIVSLPGTYRGWPQDDLTGSFTGIFDKLNDESTRFSPEDRKNLSLCTQEALKWVHKTMIVTGAPKKTKHLEILARWFADVDTTDAQLLAAAATLNAGFKKIAGVLKSGGLILTDNPCDRGKNDLEDSEAYVWYDTLDVVYIEKSFFGNDQMLRGLTHWTRILVHEMTHREAKTVDVPGRYAWGGIKPRAASFAHAAAITNADSWAFFCADCAGALTDANRAAALQ